MMDAIYVCPFGVRVLIKGAPCGRVPDGVFDAIDLLLAELPRSKPEIRRLEEAQGYGAVAYIRGQRLQVMLPGGAA